MGTITGLTAAAMQEIKDTVDTQQAEIDSAVASAANFTNRGAWAPATIYAVNNVVTRNGRTYICILAHTSIASFEPAKWSVMADRGQGELAYAATTIDATNQSNGATTAIPNLGAIVFDVIDRPVMVSLYIPSVQVGSADNVITLSIRDLSANIYAQSPYFPGIAFGQVPFKIEGRITTPGSYNLSGYSSKTGSGNFALRGNGIGGIQLRAWEI